MDSFYTIPMNNNLSHVQTNEMADTTKIGAMPIKDKFDGPAPLKDSSQRAVDAPNSNIKVPNPGFF